MAAVDYDVGRRNLGQLYTNLMDALKNKGDAENRRKAEDIERQGLFGTGIKSGDLQDLAQTGMGFIEFGEGRKERKMARAQDSFKRRMSQAKSRIDELRRFGDDDSINEIRAIQAGMSEERNKFENLMSDYEEMGVWKSGLGSKGVGYKDTGEMSSFAKKMMEGKRDKAEKQYATLSDDYRKQRGQLSDYKHDSGLLSMDEFERSDSQPDTYGDPLVIPEELRTIGSGGLARNYIRDDGGPLGPGRRSPAQSPSYGSEALEKLGPDRLRGPLRRNAQGGMQSQSQLEDRYGTGAFREYGSEGLMNSKKPDWVNYDEWSQGGYWGGKG